MKQHPHARLWYLQPASSWDEALPLGSGTLGMMVFGGRQRETLQLNEETLWSGFPAQWDNPECKTHLEKMRQLLFAHQYKQSQDLCNRYLVCAGQGCDDPYYGSFQTAGELYLDTPGAQGGDYLRSLDLYTGLAETRFGAIRRRHLASHTYQVTASFLQGADRYEISFSREGVQPKSSGASILALGHNPALDYCTVIEVETNGQVIPHQGGLTVTGGTYLVLWTSTATTYHTDADPQDLCRSRIHRAMAAGFDAVAREEARWMEEALGRCVLTLPGDPEAEALPTDQRLERMRQGSEDPGLCRLYFDFGRYLMIGSGWGRLPANLQGVWSKDLMTPWTGDYHTNINVQMNYWFLDAVGLMEYGEPLYRYFAFLASHGRATAETMYGCRGWVTHTITNPWGFTAPGQDPSWGSFLCAGAWCCRHLYEHYLYTGDKAFLREYWPVIHDSALFYRDFLVRDPGTGYLVTAPSSSPENSYLDPLTGEKTSITYGPTMDNMILRELFGFTLEIAGILGESDELTEALPELISALPPTKITRHGTIGEWIEDFRESEPGHRHISQLYGLYPGWEITPEATPELSQAAAATLQRRLSHGGGHTGWSRAWIINFYARLRDGNSAGEHLNALLCRSTLPNLFDTHPPFQIDGNFGAAAGMLEMLVQSHCGVIRLLPALPPQWKTGALDGVYLRGGFRLWFAWEDGTVTRCRLLSTLGGRAELFLNGVSYSLDTEAGKAYQVLN